MYLQYYRHISRNKHRIHSLRLSNIHFVDLLFSPSSRVKTFIRLETLILNSITSTFFEDFLLHHLMSVFTLRSLVAVLIDPVTSLNTFYRSIFRLPALKYCKLSFQARPQTTSIRIATNESSPIENLVIDSNSNFDELGPILSYVPQLHRLSWRAISRLSNEQVSLQGLTLKHLTHVSLGLQHMTFDQFEPLIISLSHKLEVLRISTSFDRGYLNSDRWEQLILTCMPYLRVFDIEHRDHMHLQNDISLTCTNLNNMFTSSFWIDHHWFFAHQCFFHRNSNQIIFYSTNPYR